MTTHSNVDWLEKLESQYANINKQIQQIQETIDNWDQTLENKLDTQLDHWEKKLKILTVNAIHAK